MIDTAQAILLFVVVVLTLLLAVLGIQVFFILRDLRKTVEKANKVLDDTSIITESVSGPISSLSNVTAGIKIGASILRVIKGKKNLLQKLAEEDNNE